MFKYCYFNSTFVFYYQNYIQARHCVNSLCLDTLFYTIFKAKDGVPALLIYKGGDMIGNFIRISDELGDDFFSSDVESILEE